MDDIEYLGASGSVLSYNLYSYCENNSVVYSDSLGISLIQDIIKKIINVTNGILSISTSLIVGIIDTLLSIIKKVIPGLSVMCSVLRGFQTIGKTLGKKFAERVFKKVFTKGFLKIIVGVSKFLVKQIIGLTINFTIGTISSFLLGALWTVSSIGNLIAGILDLNDGYFRIKINW